MNTSTSFYQEKDEPLNTLLEKCLGEFENEYHSTKVLNSRAVKMYLKYCFCECLIYFPTDYPFTKPKILLNDTPLFVFDDSDWSGAFMRMNCLANYITLTILSKNTDLKT